MHQNVRNYQVYLRLYKRISPNFILYVDRDKVKFSGVPLADVFSTMKAYTGSVYVNDFNMFNRIYRVYIQAEAPYREHKENINLFLYGVQTMP